MGIRKGDEGMSRKGTYYVGRVKLHSLLSHEKLFEALRYPVSVRHRGSAWTFLDVIETQQTGIHYFFARLSKYSPDAEVGVVDETTRSERKRVAPNLLVASSPFVYIPSHSGIVFLNVSGQIEVRTFIKRFCEIIEMAHEKFFVECNIELISNLKTFSEKLSALQGIYQLNARVSPPNPLFSPLWRQLERYLHDRNTNRLTIVEDAPDSGILETNLAELVEAVSRQTEAVPFVPELEIPVGDAAILMAADGYGNGTVKGRLNNESVVIKTSEAALNFLFDKIPEPKELYLHAKEIFERIEVQRHMERLK